MRRKDREVTDPDKIRQIIKDSHCIRIGFVEEGQVYIVPLNFGFVETDGTYTFYFHGALQGRKMDLIKKSPLVGFELDANYKLQPGEMACDYTAAFQSIIGNGTMKLLETDQEKREGLQIIMNQYSDKKDWEFPDAMLKQVAVFTLQVTSLSCKIHL